jgi:hypothetical protein
MSLTEDMAEDLEEIDSLAEKANRALDRDDDSEVKESLEKISEIAESWQ